MVTALRDGRCAVVEGRVTGFVPPRYKSQTAESFNVGSQHFAYSDETVTAGFHISSSQGGPIHEGLYVRVTSLGNSIVRLEIGE